MTRQLSSTRRTITRIVEAEQPRPRTGTHVEDDMTVVRAVIDKLADEVTEQCMTAVSLEMHSLGLRGGLGEASDLRAATREFALGRILDALQERKAPPDVLARLRVSKTRETVERILVEYTR